MLAYVHILRARSSGSQRGKCVRVKSGNFGHQVNSDSDLVCFIF